MESTTKVGALTLTEARKRGAAGHAYPGTCYVIRAPGGGHYVSSRVRCPKRCKHTANAIGCQRGGKVMARFTRKGTEI